MNDEIIKVEDVTIKFGNESLLENISFSVFDNDSLTFIGPSGCGKTTLLKVIAGVIPIEKGSVTIYGNDISKLSAKEKYWLNKKTGFLFQNYALFDSFNIIDNVTFYLANHTDMEYKEMREKAEDLLSVVGLEGVSDKFPSELSGGMKKRVGIIRAIIHKPQILFLDEPVAGLDPISTDSASKIIKKIKEKFNLTLVNISNELDCARKISNRVGIIYNKNIYNLDDADSFFSSKDPLIRQFLEGSKSGPIQY